MLNQFLLPLTFCPATLPFIVTDCPLVNDPTDVDVELAADRIIKDVAVTDPMHVFVSQVPPEQNRTLSASRRFTRPGKTLPLAFTQSLNSSDASLTLPAFKSFNIVDDLKFPHPKLNTKDVRAEN